MTATHKIWILLANAIFFVVGAFYYLEHLERRFEEASPCRSGLFKNLKQGMTRKEVREKMKQESIESVRIFPRDNLEKEWAIRIEGRTGTVSAYFDRNGKLTRGDCGSP